MKKYSTTGVSRVAVLLLFAMLSTAGIAYAYLTDFPAYGPLNYYTFIPPAAGSSYIDPTFGSTVKRISAAMNTTSALSGGNLGMVTNEYATMSAFNKDNTRLILQNDSYFGLYDGNGTYIKALPFVVNAGAEPRWSKTDAAILYFITGNQLKQIDVNSGLQTVVRTFSRYGAISGKGESDISEDGKHFVFAGDNRYVFLFDISTGAVSPAFDTGGRSFDSLYVTPNNNATITWYTNGTARYNGIELFDGKMNFQRQVARAGGHMDIARDVNGDEVLLWANSADAQPICNNGIVKIRLADAHQTCIISLDWSLAVHVSAPDSNGWVFVETYAPADPSPTSSNWRPYTNEILELRLDGSEVRRLVHHRSRPFDSYYYMPRTSCSHDGSKIVFSSNMGLQAILGYPSLYVDTYMIDVAPGSPVTAQPTTPTTTTSSTTVTRVEQNSSSVSLTGDWLPNSLSQHSGGSAVLSMNAGDKAAFTFDGTGATWIAYRDEWSGIARVYLDGSLLGQVDTYQTPSAAKVATYSVTGLSAATHTLTIEATGTKSSASGGAWVWVDAFDVTTTTVSTAPTPTPTPTLTPETTAAPVRLQQNDPAITYAGSWAVNSLALHSGGSANLAMDAGSSATLTFNGTAVSWIGYRDEWSGIAKVTLDGVVIANVDTYATPARSQAVTYSLTNLDRKTHTLVIEVSGKKNLSSGGLWVWIDAFDVTP